MSKTFRLLKIYFKTFFSNKLFAALFILSQTAMLVSIFFTLSEYAGIQSMGSMAENKTFEISAEEISPDAVDRFLGKYKKDLITGTVYGETTCFFKYGQPKIAVGKNVNGAGEAVTNYDSGIPLGQTVELDGKSYKVVGKTNLVFDENRLIVYADDFDGRIKSARFVFRNPPSAKKIERIAADISAIFEGKLSVFLPEKLDLGLQSLKQLFVFMALLMLLCAIGILYMYDYLLKKRKALYQVSKIVGGSADVLNGALFYEALIYSVCCFGVATALYFILRTFIGAHLLNILSAATFFVVMLVYLAAISLCVMIKFSLNKREDLARKKW